MIKNLKTQVLSGFCLALVLITVVFAYPAKSVAATSEKKCHWGCCLEISGWCVFECIICEDVPNR
jgi:hypothetical protein